MPLQLDIAFERALSWFSGHRGEALLILSLLELPLLWYALRGFRKGKSNEASISVATPHTTIAPKLTIELVPSTCWFSNLRSVLSSKQWRAIQERVFNRASSTCQVCSGKGSRWPVEAHEVWRYDEASAVQKLSEIVALCPACHEVKHFGFATERGRGDQALKKLMAVNSWDESTAVSYVEEQFSLWERRSEMDWSADLSLLCHYGMSREEIERLEERAALERRPQSAVSRLRELTGEE